MAVKWKETKKVLKKYATLLRQTYRKKLSKSKTNATSTLSKSVQTSVKIGAREFEVRIELEDYWKWVENGRTPGRKQPPPQMIEKWVREKPVKQKSAGYKKQATEKQLAFLIGRKIGKEGIKAKHFLSESNDEVFDDLYNDIIEAIATDLRNDLFTAKTLDELILNINKI